MVSSVPLALVSTGAAGQRARSDRGTNDAEVGFGLTRDDATGCVTDVGAIEVEANAADQPLHLPFAEAGIGAARTRGRTVEALVDAAQQQIAIEARRLWMVRDDVLNGHGSPFASEV